VIVAFPGSTGANRFGAGAVDPRTVLSVLTHDSRFDVPPLELVPTAGRGLHHQFGNTWGFTRHNSFRCHGPQAARVLPGRSPASRGWGGGRVASPGRSVWNAAVPSPQMVSVSERWLLGRRRVRRMSRRAHPRTGRGPGRVHITVQTATAGGAGVLALRQGQLGFDCTTARARLARGVETVGVHDGAAALAGLPGEELHEQRVAVVGHGPPRTGSPSSGGPSLSGSGSSPPPGGLVWSGRSRGPAARSPAGRRPGRAAAGPGPGPWCGACCRPRCARACAGRAPGPGMPGAATPAASMCPRLSLTPGSASLRVAKCRPIPASTPTEAARGVHPGPGRLGYRGGQHLLHLPASVPDQLRRPPPAVVFDWARDLRSSPPALVSWVTPRLS
jgi:hypothetical protein